MRSQSCFIDRYIPIDDTMGYLSVNGTDRPFFHAADCRYARL